MLRLIFIIGLILLICPPLNAGPIITNQAVEFLQEEDSVQFMKKYSLDNINDEGYAFVSIPAIICYYCEDETIPNDIRFFLKIHYIRKDKDYAPAKLVNDRQWFLHYINSIDESTDESLDKNEVHFFEITMYQWIKYMSLGFDGFIYFKNKRKVDFKIPKYVFTELNEAYESWKK